MNQTVIGTLLAILKMEDQLSAPLAQAEASVKKASTEIGNMGGSTSALKQEVSALFPELDKMRGSLAQAEAGLKATATSSGAAEGGLLGMAGGFGSLFAALGGAYVLTQVAGEIISIGKEAFDTANKIADLSDKTRLSFGTLQELDFIADQTGGSLESIATAALTLSRRLANGSDGVSDAVREMGLRLQDLWDQTPDQQFWTIVDALKGVSDETDRMRLATELFGQRSNAVMALLNSDYQKMREEAPKMADAHVKAIDELGDALSKNYSSVKTFFGDLIGWAAEAYVSLQKLDQIRLEMMGFNTVDTNMPGLPSAPQDYTRPPDTRLASDLINTQQAIRDTEKAFDDLTRAKERAEEAERKGLAAMEETIDKLFREQEAADKTTQATQRAVDEFARAHPVIDSVTDSIIPLTDAVIGAYDPLRDINDELDRMHEATTSKIDLAPISGQIKTLADQAVDDFNRMMEAEREEKEKAAEIARERHEAFQSLGQSFTDLGQIVGGSAGLVIHSIGGILENLERFKAISTPVAQGAAAIAEGAISVWQSTESASVGTNMLNGAISGLSAGMNPQLMAATGGWSAAIGAAAGAMVGLVKANEKANEEQRALLEQSAEMAEEWKDRVVDAFDATADGMMRLEAGGDSVKKVALMIMQTYGDLGHSTEEIQDVMKRLFDAERQGPEELQRVLDEVNDEFERHAEVVKAWADGVNTYIDGFTQRVEGFTMGLEDIRQKQEQANEAAQVAHARYEEAVVAMEKMKVSGVATQEEIIAATERAHQASMAYEAAKQAAMGATKEQLIDLQGEFDILTQYTVTAFNTAFTQSGSVIQAFEAIHTPLTELTTAMDDFGLSGGATFTKLTEIDGIIQANQDIFTSIDGLNQMMAGLDEATLLTGEDMVLFGRDATSLFDELVARMQDQGVPAAEAMDYAMLLMQPTLQKLWEGQRDFGVEIDESTQLLLDQAEQAGYVGDAHVDIQRRILQAIEGVEAAILRLPAAFANANTDALHLEDTLRRIGTAAGQIQISTPSLGGGTVASGVTDIQEELMRRWEQMYGTRDIPADVKHAQNQAAIAQGMEPIWPGFAKGGIVGLDGYAAGGMINDNFGPGALTAMYGPGAMPIVAHVGEAVLNPRATAALGRSGVDALNHGDGMSGGVTVNVYLQGNYLGTSREAREQVVDAVNEGLEKYGSGWGRHERIVRQMVRS